MSNNFSECVRDIVYFVKGDCVKMSFDDFDIELKVKSCVRCETNMSKGIVGLNFKHLDVEI